MNFLEEQYTNEELIEMENHLKEAEKKAKQILHLDRTIKELGYEEIPQTEYKRLKRDDRTNVNGYTIRVAFKYYKKKTKLTEFEQHIILYLKEFPESFKRICKEMEK
jgi:hypothetical protein